MDIKDHRILSHLDKPFYILYWTVDEVGMAMGGLVVGLMLGAMLKGFFGGCLLAYGLHTLKKRLGFIQVRHYAYWSLPHPKALKHTPPSSARLIKG